MLAQSSRLLSFSSVCLPLVLLGHVLAQVFRKGAQVSAGMRGREQQRAGQEEPLSLQSGGPEGVKRESVGADSPKYWQGEGGCCLTQNSSHPRSPAFLSLPLPLLLGMLESTGPVSYPR